MRAVRLLLVACLLASGCAAAERARVKKELYPTWPRHIQQAVDRGEVVLGMDKVQVQIATGVGEGLVQKRTTVTEYGVVETWVLWKSFGGWTFADPGFAKMVLIRFKDGRVDAVSY